MSFLPLYPGAGSALLALLCACPLTGPAACAQAGGPTAEIERLLGAMGTGLRLEVQAPARSEALRASEAAARAIEQVESRLSTWRDDSELSRLNAAPVGRPHPLGEELRRDLLTMVALFEETCGTFDPGIGALVQAWDLRGEGRRPSLSELERAREQSGLRYLELTDEGAVRRRPGLLLEEGAIGKGIALAAAARALRSAGSTGARIDLGGQLLLLGPGPHRVQLADPRMRDRSVATFELPEGSVATSGNSERGLVIEGARSGHLLDPSSGQPCRDFGSVSVWSSDPTRADALSTALFVLGPEAGPAWADQHDDVEALFLVIDGEGLTARASEGWPVPAEVLAQDLDLSNLFSRRDHQDR